MNAPDAFPGIQDLPFRCETMADLLALPEPGQALMLAFCVGFLAALGRSRARRAARGVRA